MSREAARLFGADVGGIVRFGDEGQGEVVGWQSAAGHASLEVGTQIDLSGPSAVSTVYATGRAARRRPRKDRRVLLRTLRERVAVPVRVGDRVWGALMIASAKPGVISPSAEARLAPPWNAVERSARLGPAA